MTTGALPQPPLGTTVTLAVSTPVGPIGVVGVLVAVDASSWSVRRRDGSVSVVDPAAITAGRVVPPSRASRVTVEEIQRVAALGWRGLQVEPLGGWLLRAGGGFTGRANSVLTMGDPGISVAAAVDAATAWYSDHGLTVQAQLPDGATTPGLTTELDDRGWGTSPTVHVMTAELGHVLRAAAHVTTDLEVRVDDEPDDSWLACFRALAGPLPPVAREVLVNHPQAGFASVRDGGEAVAIARAAVDERWAGLFAVEVTPQARRRGLGGLVSAAALRWAGQRGARRTYLQTSVSNVGAVALYERLGYAVRHDYLYRAPAQEVTATDLTPAAGARAGTGTSS